MLNVILLVIIILCLGSIVFMLVKKFSKLALIDLKNTPAQKQNETKRKIIEERLKRNFNIFYQESRKIIKPASSKIGETLKKGVNKIVELEEEYRYRVLNLRLKDRVFKTQRINKLLSEANALKDEEKFEIAEKKYIEIIKLDQFCLEAYKGLADLYCQTKEYEQAKETLSYALRLSGNDDFLYSQMARVFLARGDLKEAEQEYLRSINLNNNNSSYYYALGNIYLQLEEYQEALTMAKKAVSLEENNPKYLDFLLEICFLVKDKILALETWEKLKNANPENKKLSEFKEKIESL